MNTDGHLHNLNPGRMMFVSTWVSGDFPDREMKSLGMKCLIPYQITGRFIPLFGPSRYPAPARVLMR